jgi:hypothetical protein
MRFLAPFFTCAVSEQVPCFLAQRRAGSFAMIAAIRRASSLVSSLATERRPGFILERKTLCGSCI